MFHRHLAVLGGIADILGMRPLNVRELAAQRFNNISCLVQTKRRLREISDSIRIRHRQRFDLSRRTYNLGHGRRLTERADYFIVIAVADEDKRITFLGKLHRLNMDLGDEGAGRIDDSQFALFARRTHFGRHAVSAINDPLAVWNFVYRVDKDRTFALKFLNHKTVVDNLFADIDWRTKGFERNSDNINRPHNARAESARLQQKQSFLAFRHAFSWSFKDTLFPVLG